MYTPDLLVQFYVSTLPVHVRHCGGLSMFLLQLNISMRVALFARFQGQGHQTGKLSSN